VATLLGILLSACESAADPGDKELMDLGRSVFSELAVPSCATCHALREADATGSTGPNLDELRPSMERDRLAVSDGLGVMPAQSGHLTDQQIHAVAYYVARTSCSID